MSIDRSRVRPWALALTALVAIGASAVAVIALGYLRRPPLATVPAVRLALTSPEELTLGAGADYPFGLALAPDGRRLVFPAAKSGLIQLWLLDLTTGETQALPGTEDGALPFWAPDGRAIGFFAGGHLRAMTLEDGRVRDLAEAPSPRGGAWHPAGDILFAPRADGGLYRRRGSDGGVEPFSTLDASAGESGHRHPVFLNDGHDVIFFVRSNEPTRQGICLASLADPSTRKRLIGTDGHGIVVGDVVLYSSGGALVAQRVDLEARSLTDRPILLGTPVGRSPHNHLFATAGADVLVYGAPASGLRELRWTDRSGVPTGVVGEAMEAWDLRVDPDGASVAVTRLDPQINTLDIWAYDGDRPLPRRISPAIDADETPVWAHDGTRLAWVTGRRAVTVRGALAERPEETVHKFEHPVRVTDWSPDHQWIVLSESRPETHDDVMLLAADGRSEPRAYAQSTFNEVQGVVSPNGRWIAYASDESGRFEIYVDSFPMSGTRAKLTSGGGVDPRWRGDNSEVYFRRGTEIHVVNLRLLASAPEAVASERLFDAGVEIRAYDATADGRRFLLNVPAAESTSRPISVVVNVRSLLRFAP